VRITKEERGIYKEGRRCGWNFRKYGIEVMR
jgi:hypothetical protein